jgi:signal transduction histidine kinase
MDLEATKKFTSIEMGKILAEMAHEFSPQAQLKEQTFSFTPLAASAYINGDPMQMHQLFRNLIGNAIKYSPKGSTIMLAAKVEKGNIQVNVQDTGYGIPAADLPFIFDRFYRVRNGKNSELEGNGLGLAIVKSVVEGHGGKISVESEADKGTCFTLSLPLTEKTIK